MMTKLRGFQRAEEMPDFRKFCADILKDIKNAGAQGSLKQRLDLLHEFVKESKVRIG